MRDVRLWLAVLALFVPAGCGGSHERQTTYPVHGLVTLDGKPVSFGGVRFIPAGGRPLHAKIQSDGTYSLSTGDEDGAPPGKYRIAVQVREIVKPAAAMEPPRPGKSHIPEKYGDPATSGLVFEVVAGDNEHHIELSSKP